MNLVDIRLGTGSQLCSATEDYYPGIGLWYHYVIAESEKCE
jgi:hypothetical protein